MLSNLRLKQKPWIPVFSCNTVILIYKMGVAPAKFCLGNLHHLQQIALHLSTVWLDNGNFNFSESQGTSLTWHRSSEDFRDILGKGQVSWSLCAGYCHPGERRLSIKPGAGNGTKQKNRSSVFWMLTLHLFPTILVLNDLGVVAKGGVMIWLHHSGHLLEWGLSPPYLFSNMLFENWTEDGPEKWRKIGDHKEDLRGIPACEAEIGNWAVVITGCGIDVVPINQNCWINKNCSRFFFAMVVSKKCFKLLALPLFAMFQYLQQWSGKILVCLRKCISFHLFISSCVHVRLSTTFAYRDVPIFYVFNIKLPQ